MEEYDNHYNAKADHGKPRLTLVPTKILPAIAKIREYGNEKYKDPDNWKTVDTDRYLNAMYRHLLAYVSGEEDDPESGYPHLWHMACNLAFIIELDQQD